MTCFYGDLRGDLQIRGSFLWNRLRDATECNSFKWSLLHHQCRMPVLLHCLSANASAEANLQESVVSRAGWPVGAVDFERLVWILVGWLIWKACHQGLDLQSCQALPRNPKKKLWSGCRSETKLVSQLAGDLRWLGQPATCFRGPKTRRCPVHWKCGLGSDLCPCGSAQMSTERTSVAFPQKHILVEKLSHCFERGWKS